MQLITGSFTPTHIQQSSKTAAAAPTPQKINVNLEAVKQRLGSGENIDQIIDSGSGRTLLLQACADKNWYSVIYLLERGADATIADTSGKTAFQYLMEDTQKGNVFVIRALELLARTNPTLGLNMPDPKTGLRPLETAVLARNWPLVETLLNYGANQVNPQNLEILTLLNNMGLTVKQNPDQAVIFNRLLNIISKNSDPAALIRFCLKNNLNQLAYTFIRQNVSSSEGRENQLQTLATWLERINDPNLISALLNELTDPKEITQVLNSLVYSFNEARTMTPKNYQPSPKELYLQKFMQQFFKTDKPKGVLHRLFQLKIAPPANDLAIYFFKQLSDKEKGEIFSRPNSRNPSVIVLAARGGYRAFIEAEIYPHFATDHTDTPETINRERRALSSLLLTPDTSGESALTAGMKTGTRELIFSLNQKAMVLPPPPGSQPVLARTSFARVVTIDTGATYSKDRSGLTPFAYLLTDHARNKEVIRDQITFFVVNKFLNASNLQLIKDILTDPSKSDDLKKTQLRECLGVFLDAAFGIKNVIQYNETISELIDVLIDQLMLFNQLPFSSAILLERTGRNTPLMHLIPAQFPNALETTLKQVEQKLTSQPKELQDRVRNLFDVREINTNFPVFINAISTVLKNITPTNFSSFRLDDYPVLSAAHVRLSSLINYLEGNPAFTKELADLKKLFIILERIRINDAELLRGQKVIA